MAKIKWGMYITDGRGKQGGHVMSKNRAGAYVRTKVTPSNPQTTFQMNVRGIFAAISSGWSALTDAQRASFNNQVGSYQTTDIFGDLRNPTGKNLYQRLNQNLANTDQALLTVCPSPIEVPFANLQGVAGDVSDAEIFLDYNGDLTGQKVQISATPILSQGTSFVKNKLRVIGVIEGTNTASAEIQSLYVAKFGLPSAGDNIYFAVRVINAQGQASPIETVKAVITA